MRRVSFIFIALAALALSACAEPMAPPPPAEEVLLVVNSTEATLSVVPVANPSRSQKIQLGGTSPTPVGVVARGSLALVPLGLDNAVAVVDLAAGTVVRRIPLPPGSGATGAAFVNDSIAYIANPNLNSVTRINILRGDTATTAAGQYPQGLVFTRGRLFVLNGNFASCPPPNYLCLMGPSWLTVIDPITNRRLGDRDSIPLAGPGNAQFAAVGGDGLLYVMNTGSYGTGEGRLSIVDPVARQEVASFAGFGNAPGRIAISGERLFVSSFSEGLMVFDTRTRQVVRGAGQGIPARGNSAVDVDSQGRIYLIESGPCQGGNPGRARIFDTSLNEIRSVPLGECSFGTAVTKIGG